MNDVIIIDGKACHVLWTQEGTETWDVAGNVTQFDLKCYVIGDVSKRSAMQAIWENSPETYENLPRYNIKFDGYDEDKNAEFTVSYQGNTSSGSSGGSADDENAVEISFSTGGGTKHVVQAIDQIAIWKANDKIDEKTPIGWNGKDKGEEEYAGVDVPDANIQLTLTVKRKMSDLGTNWQRNIAKVTGRVNSKKFRGWNIGEVLFEGVSLSGKEDDDNVSVSYNFSIRCGEKNVKVAEKPNGDAIIIRDKRGFEYAWAVTETDAKTGKKNIKAVFLSEVIPYADFSILGV